MYPVHISMRIWPKFCSKDAPDETPIGASQYKYLYLHLICDVTESLTTVLNNHSKKKH